MQEMTSAMSGSSGSAGQMGELKEKIGSALEDGRRGLTESAVSARDTLADDMTQLRNDLAGLKDTITRFVSESGSEAATTAKKVGEAVASQVGSAASGVAEAGADIANTAKEQMKTFASELEGFAKRQPLGALAGALVVGMVVGLLSRGRH